ncbi:HAD-IB family phosphatase [Candidatus Micrarchaeota archaeon]|nr:HAD-IB family phosphatase [Candidatus Micrarchaeota archaeon]
MLAVFDLEGTLCEGEFWDSFPQTMGAAAEAMSGGRDFRESVQARFAAVAGMPTGEFVGKGSCITSRPEARAVVGELRREGFEVAIASGGFDFFVGRIAGELGVRNWIANSVEGNGRVEGFKEPLVDAAGKRAFVERLQRELGVTPRETVVIGDGANDLEMMAAGGLRISFNGKPVVEKRADVVVRGSLAGLVPHIMEFKKVVSSQPRAMLVGRVDSSGAIRQSSNCISFSRLSRGELLEKIGRFDALVYRGEERLDEEFFNHAGRLKLVVRPGVGVDHIDLQAAAKMGVRVESTPCASTRSVAELSIGLMLSLLRNIPKSHSSMVVGEWRKDDLEGFSLHGRTVGIVGLGRIGRAVARRLRAFDAVVVAFDPFLHAEDFAQLGVWRVESLGELLGQSDIVSLHVPLTEKTRGMIGPGELGLMRKTAFLINTSRGAVVDGGALVAALNAGVIAGAALDVFEQEPLPQGGLRECGNVVLTPHLGGSTAEAQGEIDRQVAAILSSLGAGV